MRNLIYRTLAICLLCSLIALPSAQGVTIGLDRLLGTTEPGVPANEDNELDMLNFLIAGYNAGNPTGTNLGDNPADPGAEVNYLNFSGTTLIPAAGSAPLASSWTAGGTTALTLNLGVTTYQWIGAKYGNDTAFFYIGDIAGGPITLLSNSAGDIFDSAQQNSISHSTFFSGTGTSIVPVSVSTLWALGFAFVGLKGLSRKLKAQA